MPGAIRPDTQPSAAMLAACGADPAMTTKRLDFAVTTREVLDVPISGLLAHSAGRPGQAS